MQNARPFIAAIVVVLVLLFGAAYYFSQKAEEVPLEGQQAQNENGQQDVTSGDSITAKHQFVDGTHTIAGEINLPTPCHLLLHEVIVRESFPEQVTIAFSSSVEDAELCIQVITPQRYKVSFEASEGALITATLDDEPIVLNLVKVGENENLDDFEVYFKG